MPKRTTQSQIEKEMLIEEKIAADDAAASKAGTRGDAAEDADP